MTARASLVALSCAAGLAAGCSSSATQDAASGVEALRADVRALTQYAADKDWAEAKGVLAQLRSDVTVAVSSGELTAAQARAIRADANQIASDLAIRAPNAAPTPTRTRTPTTRTTDQTSAPAPEPKPKPSKDGHGKHKHGDEEG